MKKQAFTLVELIVVITILAILATIGFVSFSGYLAGTRDTNRIAQLKSMSDALELYRTKKDLPIPDDKVDVQASGTTIAYQGYIGANVLETIEYTEKGLDPKDKNYFSYYLSKDKKYFQLLTFLEEPNVDILAGVLNKIQAVDYTNRYPKVTGKKLGILTDTDNIPIQDISSVTASGYIDVLLNTTSSIAHFEDGDTFSGTGKLLYALMKHKALKRLQPDDCADGFIPVPANPELGQEGFCVAQYEMSHVGLNTPNSNLGGSDFNTVKYTSGTLIESKAGKYPIADINQGESITACQSMGEGYHLITNQEWIMLSRNIELQKENWSGIQQGDGFISNGISNDTALGCGPKGGNTETRAYATKTGVGSDTSCNSKRKHTLSNGQVIWDMSGNIQEHVNKADTINGSGYDTGANPVINVTNSAWYEWTTASSNDQEKYGPYISNWDVTNGMGRYYQFPGTVFFRGGFAYDGSNAGIFSLYLSWSDGNQSRHSGFRCTK